MLALASIVAFFLYLTWQIDEYEEQLRRRAQARAGRALGAPAARAPSAGRARAPRAV